jgi:hypothetical protein
MSSYIPSYLLPKTVAIMIAPPPTPLCALVNANQLSRGNKHKLICHLNVELLVTKHVFPRVWEYREEVKRKLQALPGTQTARDNAVRFIYSYFTPGTGAYEMHFTVH